MRIRDYERVKELDNDDRMKRYTVVEKIRRTIIYTNVYQVTGHTRAEALLNCDDATQIDHREDNADEDEVYTDFLLGWDGEPNVFEFDSDKDLIDAETIETQCGEVQDIINNSRQKVYGKIQDSCANCLFCFNGRCADPASYRFAERIEDPLTANCNQHRRRLEDGDK